MEEKKGTNLNDYKLNKGTQHLSEFINRVNQIAPDLAFKPPATSVQDLLISPEKQKQIAEAQKKTKDETIKQLRGVYYKYKDIVSPDRLKITYVDITIFVITTFVFRFIALLIIDWALSSNIINTFYDAFLMYFCVYILLFIFITMLVNVIVYYPILNVYTSLKIIELPNLFYYFYIYTNGYIRLVVHIFFIVLIIFIPYIVNIDKIIYVRNQNNKINITYDLNKKQKIYDSIALFSFILWLFTSLIAVKI